MKILPIAVLVMASAIILAPRAWASDGYRIESRSIPAGYETEVAFLEVIKSPSESHEAFNAKHAPHWDADALAQYIAASGVE